MKALFASAALAAVLVTPAFADFYIVQEPTSKRCIIVEERPAIGVLGSFTVRAEAEASMTTLEACLAASSMGAVPRAVAPDPTLPGMKTPEQQIDQQKRDRE